MICFGQRTWDGFDTEFVECMHSTLTGASVEALDSGATDSRSRPRSAPVNDQNHMGASPSSFHFQWARRGGTTNGACNRKWVGWLVPIGDDLEIVNGE